MRRWRDGWTRGAGRVGEKSKRGVGEQETNPVTGISAGKPRVAIVYFSQTGNTEKVAGAIAR